MGQGQSDRFAAASVIAVLVAAFALGGGGSQYGLANLLIQLVALGALAFHRDAFLLFWRDAPLALRGMILLSVALPLLQLIPLPPSIWTSLPGRVLVESAVIRAQPIGWMPFSVDPIRTSLALTGLIVPTILLMIGWSLSLHRLSLAAWSIVAFGLATLAIGAIQVTSNGTAGTIFQEGGPTSLLLGTFANRNSTGLLLVFALALAVVLPAPKPVPMVLPVRLGICVLLVLAIVLTRSRTAFVLTAIPIVLGLIRAYSHARMSKPAGGPARSWLTRPATALLGSVVLLAVAASALVMAAPGRLGQTLERFENIEEARLYIWEDATYAIDRYWPLGSGMGTFEDVFQVDESLENLTRRRAGRAHNDYLEIAIEAGVPGIALIAFWALFIVYCTWRARQSHYRWLGWSGSAFLLAVALQSVTDYPLRNQTLLALAGFATLVLVRTAFDPKARQA